MRKGGFQSNITWQIGNVIIIDISTRLHHRVSTMINVIDYDTVFVKPGRWYAFSQRGLLYAGRTSRVGRKTKTTAMHRIIFPAAEQRDHKNGDGLNNLRSNLRPCSHTENIRNRSMHKNNSLGFKGVSQHASKFRARIRVDGKDKIIGTFLTPQEAAAAYDNAAKQHYGDFARLNEGA